MLRTRGQKLLRLYLAGLAFLLACERAAQAFDPPTGGRTESRPKTAWVRPTGTYRVQLGPQFTFKHLIAQLPYLRALGISHVYLSPIREAVPGSAAGYNITDYGSIRAALGGREGYRELLSALKEHELGLVFDEVPNHMAVHPRNADLQQVLEHGPRAGTARHFDFDQLPTLRPAPSGERDGTESAYRAGHKVVENRVVLPWLDQPIEDVVASGRTAVQYANDGRFTVHLDGMQDGWRSDPRTVGSLLLQSLRSIERGHPHAAELQRLRPILEDLCYLDRRAARAREDQQAAADRALEALQKLWLRHESVRTFVARALWRLNGDPERLKAFLEQQRFELAYWREGEGRLTYRRFFQLGELIANETENPAVFEKIYGPTFEMIREAAEHGIPVATAMGLRFDHVDGFDRPVSHTRKVERRLKRLLAQLGLDDATAPPLYVEKIYSNGERPIQGMPGTTGYTALAKVDAVLLDPQGAKDIASFYRGVVLKKEGGTFDDEVRSARRDLLLGSNQTYGARQEFKRDVDYLVRGLRFLGSRAKHAPPAWGSLQEQQVRAALVELILSIPVYRAYTTVNNRKRPSERDRLLFEQALSHCEALTQDSVREEERLSAGAVSLLRDVFLPNVDSRVTYTKGLGKVLSRFHVLCAASKAKAEEDTAFYRDNFLYRDVGFDMGHVPDDPRAEFHAANRRRVGRDAMLAGATHDTKGSTDWRNRVRYLSEIPAEWIDQVKGLHDTFNPNERVLDYPTEYTIYRTLVGLWPLTKDGVPTDAEIDELLLRTIGRDRDGKENGHDKTGYFIKAVREAKLHTNWINQNSEYESGVRTFVRDLLTDRGFVTRFGTFIRSIQDQALWSGEARSVLHYGSPGTSDTYWGNEINNSTVVDPDNRQPVNFEYRKDLLAQLDRELQNGDLAAYVAELVKHPEDPKLKLHVARSILWAKKEHADLFRKGTYRELEATGSTANGSSAEPHVTASARRRGREVALTIAPRLIGALGGKGPPVGPIWGEAVLRIPPDLRGARVRNVITGEIIVLRAEHRLSELMGAFPGAVLVGERAVRE